MKSYELMNLKKTLTAILLFCLHTPVGQLIYVGALAIEQLLVASRKRVATSMSID